MKKTKAYSAASATSPLASDTIQRRDATDREARFAAFARYRAGDERVSLALWKDLLETSPSPQMQDLAARMIRKLERAIRIRQVYGDDFVGPVPEFAP